MTRPVRRSTQCAVVGAGMSGLAAAAALSEEGVDVVVVEARDRVGGRVCSQQLDDGTWIDLGGQWVGSDHRRLRVLAERHGQPLVPQYDAGATVLHARGTSTQVRGRVPFGLGPVGLPALAAGIVRLDRLARTVPAEAPWTAPKAWRWDAQTLASWLEGAVPHQRARAILTATLTGILAVEPAEVSMLHALAYLHSGGGLETLSGTTGAAQDAVLRDGVQSLADSMAAGLDVLLEAPVRTVSQDEHGVRLDFDGGSLDAERVVVALPPTLAGRLRYGPPLPEARDQLTQRMPQGTAIKCIAVYPRPFWRDAGLSGLVLDGDGPVSMIIDGTRDPGRNGVLIGFIEGAAARASGTNRREAVLSCFERHMGPDAATPRTYVERDWSTEEFTRGCYAGMMPPGAWTAYGPALRAPVGRIHWAGTETATQWMGYIEGAVQAGERAAAEVLAQRGVAASRSRR